MTGTIFLDSRPWPVIYDRLPKSVLTLEGWKGNSEPWEGCKGNRSGCLMMDPGAAELPVRWHPLRVPARRDSKREPVFGL